MPWFFHPTERFRHFPSLSDAIKYKKVLNFPILKFFPAKISKFYANILVFFRPTERFRHFPSVSGAIKYKKVLNFPILKFFPAKFYVPFLSCLCLVLVASPFPFNRGPHRYQALVLFRMGRAEALVALMSRAHSVRSKSRTRPSRDHLPRTPQGRASHGHSSSLKIRCKDTNKTYFSVPLEVLFSLAFMRRIFMCGL